MTLTKVLTTDAVVGEDVQHVRVAVPDHEPSIRHELVLALRHDARRLVDR